MRHREYLLKAVGYLIAFTIGIVFALKCPLFAPQPKESIRVVQTTTTDTIRLVEPKETIKRVVVNDTIKIHVTDTILKIDTIYLPREQRVYEDSLYRAVVSGYDPRLDSIEVYRPTITITKIATHKEWRKLSYGLQAGVGIVSPAASTPSFGWYMGVGIGYTF